MAQEGIFLQWGVFEISESNANLIALPLLNS